MNHNGNILYVRTGVAFKEQIIPCFKQAIEGQDYSCILGSNVNFRSIY